MDDIPIFQVDAFTDQAFSGNPAAVCVLPRPVDSQWMQLLASEMNLSETAFVWPLGESWSLRWFTPAAEVDLCGHATLATTHALRTLGYSLPITFETRSGKLVARRPCYPKELEATKAAGQAEVQGEAIELDFPQLSVHQAEVPDALLSALAVGRQSVVWAGRCGHDYLLQLDQPNTVRRLAPNFGQLAAIDAQGVIVTSTSDDHRFDFISRFFAPAIGIDEDPVTGSAHCCLAPFWQEQLGGKSCLRAFQASRRGGSLTVTLRNCRVHLLGRAVTIFQGWLKIPLPAA